TKLNCLLNSSTKHLGTVTEPKASLRFSAASHSVTTLKIFKILWCTGFWGAVVYVCWSVFLDRAKLGIDTKRPVLWEHRRWGHRYVFRTGLRKRLTYTFKAE